MNKSTGKLNVYFDDPFWVGVFERTENGRLSVCKVTFGAEPKDGEVWEFVLGRHHQLSFSPEVKAPQKQTADNPKRQQRQVKRQLTAVGIGTKSQQALALQREALKTEHRSISKEQKEAKRRRRFDNEQKKKKEKRKGH